MRHEKLVWVTSRIAIVSSCAWTLFACSSKGLATPNTYPTPDAGPVPCTVTTTSAPTCQLLVEPIETDAATDDASSDDAGDLDASTLNDADVPDATLSAGDASCPLTVTSEIACGDIAPTALTVAANENGEAYAAIVTQLNTGSTMFASQLVDLKPDGTGTTSLEPVPRASDVRAKAVVNADGTAGIVAERPSGDFRYFTQSGGAWNAEAIPETSNLDFALLGAASAKGQVFALFASDTEHTSLATRAASGGWTAAAPLSMQDAIYASLAVDSEGTPYVLGYGNDASSGSFFLSTGGAAPISSPAPSQMSGSFALAIGGKPGASKDALAFLQNDEDSSIDLYDVADRNAGRTIGGFVSGTCPSFTIGFTCDDCQVGAQCDTYLDKIDAFSTALTADGTVWVGYVASSVDEKSVVELDNDPILPLGCVCTTSTQSTSATSATIVIAPLGAKGADTGVSLRIPVPAQDGPTAIAMTAAGSTLHVFATKDGKISHIAIDTSRVPH